MDNCLRSPSWICLRCDFKFSNSKIYLLIFLVYIINICEHSRLDQHGWQLVCCIGFFFFFLFYIDWTILILVLYCCLELCAIVKLQLLCRDYFLRSSQMRLFIIHLLWNSYVKYIKCNFSNFKVFMPLLAKHASIRL